MFDTLLGLPAHPLYVHFAVGLVPLAALLTGWGAWLNPVRRRVVALPLVLLNVLSTGMAFVAKESGEKLEHHLPKEPLIEAHAELGDVLPVFAGVMLLASLLMWWLGRRALASSPMAGVDAAAAGGFAGATAPAATRRRGVETALAVVATILALLTCWWTFRVGHSGATSVWHDTPLTQNAPASEGGDSD